MRDRFTEIGFRAPPDNRIDRSLWAIVESSQADGIFAGAHARLAEAHRAIIEAFLIVHTTSQFNEFRTDRLSCLFEGLDFPRDDRLSRPRDLQFELFVAALLTLGGMRGVTFKEPDLVFKGIDQEIGVAIKRISGTSIKKLHRRAHEALAQIRKSNLLSVIVLNLDRMAETMPPSQGEEFVTREIAEVRRWIGMRKAEDDVLAIVGFATRPQWELPPQIGLGGFSLYAALQFIVGHYSQIDPTIEFLRQFRLRLNASVARAISDLDPYVWRLKQVAFP